MGPLVTAGLFLRLKIKMHFFMNKLRKEVDKKDLYKEFILAINGILQLTQREMDVLEALMRFDDEQSQQSDHKNVISAECRKRIKDEVGVTPDNLSRYISKFKEKGIVVNGKAEDEYYINKAVMPEIILDRVQITLILRLRNENR